MVSNRKSILYRLRADRGETLGMKKNLYNAKIFTTIVVIAVFLLHFTMNFSNDDIWFSEQLNLWSYKEFISTRYYGWTSRLVIETVLLIITRLNVNIWRFLDTVMTMMGVPVVLKLINKDNDHYINAIGWLCFLCYPILELSGAGWAATTVNYGWCFSLGMISFLPLINREFEQKTSIAQYILSAFSLVYAINQEQMCALILVFHMLYGINGLRQKKYSKYNLFCILLSVASIIFIMTCPGNQARVVSETQTWYPEFADFGLAQKIYLGVISTASVLISDKVILLIFSLILAGAAWIYSRKTISKVISAVFLMMVSIVTCFKPLLIRLFPSIDEYFNILNYQGIPTEDIPLRTIGFVFTVIIVLFACIVYLIFVVFGTRQLLPQFIFLGGACSHFIMGWSPTVFASGTRTAFFLYMALIMVCIFMINKLHKEDKMTDKMRMILMAILAICVLANWGKTLTVNVLSQ